MEEGLLSLKWNNHKSTFFHILSNLRRKEFYTDATIACEGKFFPVHKLVMSTCSDYFCDIFERTSCKCPVVILKDIKYQELEALLDYMYLGEVDVKQSDLAGLIKAAECLRVKGLAVPDEDPSTPKKLCHVPESRCSPSAKRSRRSSGGLEDMRLYSQSKMHRSHSPSNHCSGSSKSVPLTSHENEGPLSHSMLPPYSDYRHDLSSSSEELSSHRSEKVVAVDSIKVEVDDDKDDSGKPGKFESSHSSERGDSQKSLTNNFVDYKQSDLRKDDQIESYNGSDIPGPSGVQGASSLIGWDEDGGSFPQNIFGGEDQSHQQVKKSACRLKRNLQVKLQRIETPGRTNYRVGNIGSVTVKFKRPLRQASKNAALKLESSLDGAGRIGASKSLPLKLKSSVEAPFCGSVRPTNKGRKKVAPLKLRIPFGKVCDKLNSSTGRPKLSVGSPENSTGPIKPSVGLHGNSTGPPKLTVSPPGNSTGPPKLSVGPLGNSTVPPKLSVGPPGMSTGPPKLSVGPPGLPKPSIGTSQRSVGPPKPSFESNGKARKKEGLLKLNGQGEAESSVNAKPTVDNSSPNLFHEGGSESPFRGFILEETFQGFNQKESKRSELRHREREDLYSTPGSIFSVFKDYDSYQKYLDEHREAITFEVHLDEPDVCPSAVNGS